MINNLEHVQPGDTIIVARMANNCLDGQRAKVADVGSEWLTVEGRWRGIRFSRATGENNTRRLEPYAMTIAQYEERLAVATLRGELYGCGLEIRHGFAFSSAQLRAVLAIVRPADYISCEDQIFRLTSSEVDQVERALDSEPEIVEDLQDLVARLHPPASGDRP
jgi:hypothetical protein